MTGRCSNENSIPNARNPPSREPTLALIVGAGRSGTTLLRLLLDAHRAIGSPAEAGIPALISHVLRVWWTVSPWEDQVGLLPRPPAEGADGQRSAERTSAAAAEEIRSQTGGLSPRPIDPPQHVRAAARAAVMAPMRQYCANAGKQIYCDKSLDSVYSLGAVKALFPDVRCLMLFRHVMDVVASGIEASPWGFTAYGYLPFVQNSADNFVAALASHWLNHVSAALQWEERNPDLCHRVRYEDLVCEPERSVTEILAFLGVDVDLSILERAFDIAGSQTGPGDHKIGYTNGVHKGSIGHGKRVPVGMIPPPLLEAVNVKLEALGYQTLTDAWNAEPRADTSGPSEVWRTRLAELMRDVRIAPLANSDGGRSFAVVAEDDQELRWVIEPATGEVRQGDGEVETVLIGTAEDLTLMIAEDENAGALLRAGRIRHVTLRGDLPTPEVAKEMKVLLDVLRRHAPRSVGTVAVGSGE